MTYSALILLAPMLLGAQIIITLVLQKGEICPGQRGRVHKLLPALGVLWLAITSVELLAFLVAGAIFYFYSKVKVGKTKDKGPLWMLYFANGLAIAFVVSQLSQFDSIAAYCGWILYVFLLGAVFANLTLTIARSRLDAFHRLLPFVGLTSGIAFAATLFVQLLSIQESILTTLLWPLSIGLLLLISGLLIWSVHLFASTIAVTKARLVVALVMLYAACLSFYPIMQL
ncbi:hypothetical protein MACH09_12750 [Vibrio sp. MACH09]|uniref:hypothetical protein n=1 Tax=Vibrio sp. MACH09 TaxID=3025122 RepID=UPI00278D2758|nr:hypothetical protein [Vibrio sp. MACH09]GLO60767.1 hypothetical protein MACH09_12750 [Vibrio sp. MACH09]